MKVDLGTVISFVALIVSLISIYLQWFRVRGAIISLLNTEGEQRTILLSYNRLPEAIRQHYPEYQERHSGYAIVRFVFANSGDRAGLVEIKKIDAKHISTQKQADKDQIKASYYNYNLIPAYNIKTPEILLRNIPPLTVETIVDVTIRFDWGGSEPRRAGYQRKGSIERTVKVLLVPSDVNERKV